MSEAERYSHATDAVRYMMLAREQEVRRRLSRLKRNRIESMMLFLGCIPHEIYENDRRQIVVLLPVAP